MTRRMTGLAFLLALVLAACGDATGPDSISGRYTLRTVNGGSLPYTLFQVGNDRIEITAGSVQLNSDGTFSIVLTSRTVQGGSTSITTDNDNGTWMLTGNQLSLRYSDNSVDTAVVGDGQLTIISNDVSFVFHT